jgi:hypothetical protein
MAQIPTSYLYVIISELKFFLLTGFLTQNFNIVDLENSKTSHLDCSHYIEDDIMQNHEQKQKVKKNMGATRQESWKPHEFKDRVVLILFM